MKLFSIVYECLLLGSALRPVVLVSVYAGLLWRLTAYACWSCCKSMSSLSSSDLSCIAVTDLYSTQEHPSLSTSSYSTIGAYSYYALTHLHLPNPWAR